MSSQILKKEKNIVTIEFTVSQSEFSDAINKAYLKMKDKINVQGFRKGKAPRHIIEKKYGKSIFYDEALDIAIQEKYPTVISELKLDVIDSPKVNIEKFEESQDIVISADVEVMPEVEVSNYLGVEVENKEITVTDDDIESEIKKIQDKNSRLIEVEDRPVQKGDFLTIDYAGFVGEEQFEGGTAENQTLEIGSNTFIPGFEDQLVGKNKGEEVKVNVTFPEDYNAENLKGKDAVFNVVIHEIKMKELPVIDDEFAKDVSEFNSLEELKHDTKNKLQKRADDNNLINKSNNVVTKIANNTQVEVPEVLIKREIEMLGRNYEQQFRQQGFAGKEYDQLIKNFVDQYKQSARPQAEFNVKVDLILEAITKKENIVATEEEILEEINKVADQYEIVEDKREAFIENLKNSDMSYFKESVTRKKTVNMLVEKAVFIEPKKEEEQK